MKSITLNSLLSSISTAIADANHTLLETHVQRLRDQFKGVSGGGGLSPSADAEADADAALTPRTVKLRMPVSGIEDEGLSPDAASEPDHVDAEIPLLTLSSMHQIMLDGVEMNLDCIVEDVLEDEGDQGRTPKLSLLVGGHKPRGAQTGNIQLKFRLVDAPEGVQQLNDAMLREF